MFEAPILSGANFFLWLVAFAVAAGAALTVIDLMTINKKDKKNKQLPEQDQNKL